MIHLAAVVVLVVLGASGASAQDRGVLAIGVESARHAFSFSGEDDAVNMCGDRRLRGGGDVLGVPGGGALTLDGARGTRVDLDGGGHGGRRESGRAGRVRGCGRSGVCCVEHLLFGWGEYRSRSAASDARSGRCQ